MRVIAFRVSLLACALATAGACLDAAPMVWTSAALALVAAAALVAEVMGVTP